MNEKDWFLPGNKEPEIVEFRGCRLGMMICFDWIFPETARTLALKGAHIICHPANLVMPFCQSAMITRCLENRVFAMTANRIGEEARGGIVNRFTGQSQIISPSGNILYRALNNKDEVGFADINYRESEDKALNEKNNLWEDRRPRFYFDYGKKKL
jgi:predicted amidohydrolase